MERPGRTFGLSIAILLSVMMFSVVPLLQVLLIVTVNSRFQNLDFTGQPYQPLATGAYFIGVADSTLVVQVILGLLFLGVAILAWRGKPSAVRFIMVGAIVLLTSITVVVSVAPLLQAPDFQQGLDSGEDIRRSLLAIRAAVSVLVSLYVVWYLNRGPARAFYRGYYLTAPELPNADAGQEEVKN